MFRAKVGQAEGFCYRQLSNAFLRFGSFCVLSGCVLSSGCGGGGGSSTTPPQSPTITSVNVTCAATSVPTSQTSQCSATVSGTGSYSSGVTWAVNGTSGGSSTYGAVNASGLYQAPATAPAAYLVTVSATSTADSTKSGSFSVLIAGTIATATQPIVASTGGTISLPGGNSVTIPAGTLTANTTATLQLSSVATQPTNPVFGGIQTECCVKRDRGGWYVWHHFCPSGGARPKRNSASKCLWRPECQ